MHQLITKIGKGQRGAKDLSWGEAKQAAQDLMEGNATPYQAGAFLMAMRIKLEGVTELALVHRRHAQLRSPHQRSGRPQRGRRAGLCRKAQYAARVPSRSHRRRSRRSDHPVSRHGQSHGVLRPSPDIGATGHPRHVARTRPACKPATERIRVPGHRVVSPPLAKLLRCANNWEPKTCSIRSPGCSIPRERTRKWWAWPIRRISKRCRKR